MQPADAPSDPDKGQKHGFFVVSLREVVRRIDDQGYLFVIAIAILLIVLAILTSVRGTPDSRFITIVIAIMALSGSVIILAFIAKLVRVEKRQDLQQSEIDAIHVALRGILTKHEFGPLKGLNGPGKVELHKEPNLVNYLHRLDGLEFIQPNPGYGLINIEQLENGKAFDLKEYCHITSAGEKYLKIAIDLEIFKSNVNWYDPHPFR